MEMQLVNDKMMTSRIDATNTDPALTNFIKRGDVMATNKPTAASLVGQTFGYLKLLSAKSERHPTPSSKRWKYRFLCTACGRETLQLFYVVCVERRVKSCGCKQIELAAEGRATHGYLRGGSSAEYTAFQNARNRCTKPNTTHYEDYGGRGIEFRFSSFKEFIAHLGPRPTQHHSIDRINNNGHYEPGNVRWATRLQQGQNTRKSWHITIDGVTRTQRQWAILAGIADRTISDRIKRGYCVKCAVFAPVEFRWGKPCGHTDSGNNRVWRLK